MKKLFLLFLLTVSLLFLTVFWSNAQNQGPLRPSELAKQKWFTSLEEATKTPDKVYKLTLRDQKLTEFPKEILLFKNLQVLDLSYNKLTTLPPEVYKLKNLQELNLYRNRIQSLPSEIGDLSNLEHFYIGKNRIVMFPVEILGLQRLKVFDISSNHLTLHEIDFVKKHLKRCEIRL
ncbi:MAG: leucine-rich repeat domain-containing protein [Bacteroidia bacterium]|nr:leucine-rich repeat domain-containing protein [Bacteroidia bacterium]